MSRFFRRGKSKIYWLAAVAAPSAGPTSGELAAGVDLSPGVTAIAGFQLTSSTINTPILSSVFTPNIPGEDTTAASSLTFFDDDGGTSTFKTLLTKGTKGYVVLMPYGKVTAKRCEVWESQVSGDNDEWTLANEGARFVVTFATLSPPEQSAVLP